ncbi:hypothetical protein D3C75_850640 [compost metagenome]
MRVLGRMCSQHEEGDARPRAEQDRARQDVDHLEDQIGHQRLASVAATNRHKAIIGNTFSHGPSGSIQ